jgi:hypothetical protein
MYPNKDCVDCPEEGGANLPVPNPCGDECAEIVDPLCINYTGNAFSCDATPILIPGDNLNATLERIANQICNGVSGIAATLDVGTVTVNQVAYDTPASGTIVNSGTQNAAVLDITLNIPEGVPADAVNIKAESTDSETLGTGSKTFTFTQQLVGPYIWDNGTRIRAYHDASNYMEGIVTAHDVNTVTINVDYVVGSGTYATWEIILTGDYGSQGLAGTVDVNNVTVNSVGSQVTPTVVVQNFGTTSAALLDFTFNIPAGNGVASAAINASGELELTLEDSTVLNAGNATLQGVPIGGAQDEILIKQSATNFDVAWATLPTDGWVPTGGTAGQHLIKQSGADYDIAWVDQPFIAASKPGLSVGQAVPEVYVSTEAELLNAIILMNASEADYLGARIYIAADITLTADISGDFTGIEIHGDGNYHIDVQSAGTNYKFVVTNGSPLFKNVIFKNTEEKVSAVAKPHKQVLQLNNTTTTPSVVKFIDCKFEDISMGDNGTGSSIQLVDAPLGSEVIIDGCSIQSDPTVDVGTPAHTVKLVIESVSAAWEGSVTIKNMKWTRATNKGQGNAPATATPGSEISSIYFEFIGTWGTASGNILNIDMESYAYSLLNSHFGASDSGNVYIHNSMFMYDDNNNASATLKPNNYGDFGWNNPNGTHPLDQTAYS